MKIPVKLLNKWEALKSHGDIKEIAELAGVSSETVRRAFVNEKCDDELFVIMADFFKDKEEILKDYMENDLYEHND